ncbi:ABC transporter ATP-binding protein [Neisseriaceae bacterium TC5R-5]|nr:ABC transporter ATP-binding protein [Neisseriaceae bacterium TC5R-5]
MMAASLSIRQLDYTLSGHTLLHGIDLAIPAAQVSVVLGPNGAGKTTLLRLLAGLRKPSRGAVLFDDQCLEQLTESQRAQRIAWVAQHPPTGIPLSVREFVSLGRLPYLGSFQRMSTQDRHLIDEVLSSVELSEHAEHKLASLSGGEYQRAAIARALAQQTPILLLDEPTNHLDIRHQHCLQEWLLKLSRQGKTIVQVLHDLTLAADYADYALLLHEGRLLATGTPSQVLTPERLSAVYRWPIRLHNLPSHHDWPGTYRTALTPDALS